MKNCKISFYLLLLLLFFAFNTSQAQNQGNYYTICSHLDEYYNSNSKLKAEDEGSYKQYIRWKEFWKNRVYGKNDNLRGSFDISLQAWQQYKNEQNNYKAPAVIGSDWQSLGPDSLSYHNIGQVTSVYVDTINDKTWSTIYVGAASSGIWKTVDGGRNWVNVTDGSGLFITGITEIAGVPSNGELLYATIGGSFMGQGYNSGIGIIKSYDRGVTWRII